MSTDAVVRIRLAVGDAKADYDALTGHIKRNQPTVGLGMGGGSAGGGGAMGHFNLAGILGPLLSGLGAVYGRDAAGTLGSLVSASTAPAAQAAERWLFDNTKPNLSGYQRAAEETARTLGLARGYGMVGKAETDSLFNTLGAMYATEARGQRDIMQDADKVLKYLADQGLNGAVDKITDAIATGFRSAFAVSR
jgi:hypothetical protein